MTYKIQGEAPFQVLATNFSLGPSNEGYTLQVSADGNNYSDLFTVAANTTRMVTGVASGSYYRMSGNNSEVVINWRTQCNDGGSGGGSGAQGPQGPAGGGGDSAQTMTLINNAIANNNANLEDGDPIVGIAKQLYDPNGVTSDELFAYRTTAGNEDVSTGPAELRKVKGNAIYPETQYSDDVGLIRSGIAVDEFSADVAWGETGGWEHWISVEDSLAKNIQKIKFNRTSNTGTVFLNYQVRNVDDAAPTAGSLGINFTTTGITSYYPTGMTAVTSTQMLFGVAGMEGVVNYDGTDIIAEITGGTVDFKAFISTSTSNGGTGNPYIWDFVSIPNDIPIGTSNYTYDGSDWTPSLPQAITAMTLNGSTYVPENGDEITITRIVSKSGSVAYPAPEAFVALGLNSFKKEGNEINFNPIENYKIVVTNEGADYNLSADESYNIYAIKAVTGLSNGYVIYHKSGSSISWAGVANGLENPDMVFSATVHTSTYDVVYPTAEFPYIVFSTDKDEENMICVHPRWSGYRNEDYEDYSESVINILTLNEDCPLLSVGTTRNIWDLENQQLIVNIEKVVFSDDKIEDLIEDGKVLGTDFDFDEDYIYYVSDDPQVIDIELNNRYTANDFSVEFFSDGSNIISMPVYAETYYMNNLVDKLRRLDSVVVNLMNTTEIGERGKLYNYNGRLLIWNNSAGSWGEWFACPNDAQSQYNNTGADLYASLVYSVLPTGQTKLCDTHYFNTAGTYVVYDSTDDKIKCYSDTGYTTVYATISKGDTNIQANNLTSKVYISWIEGIIQFRLTNYTNIRNRISTTTNSGHYEVADKSFANRAILPNNYDFGIPVWNKQGIVVGMRAGYNEKTVYFNNTGYSKNYHFLIQSGSNDAPTRMFVPTSSGEAGQVLTSAGNAEPVWATMIKAVQITSAAYDALTVKDPNTLYLIVDE